ALDPQGDLWVADGGNDRVVEFVPPFHTGMAATVAIGQTSLAAAAPGSGADGMGGPGGIGFGSGDLWVTDPTHDRVLGFAPPFATGEAAAVVLGQSGPNGSAPGTSATNLSAPSAVAASPNGTLWVVDTGNDRLLAFPAPVRTGEAAAVVLGAATATAAPTGQIAAPRGIAIDPQGNVWLADAGGNRTLEFVGPTLSNGSAPTVALGQGSVTDHAAGSGPYGETAPDAVASG
ncbi:hypothetical protein B2A_11723, partial [mine drainage metagenome]